METVNKALDTASHAIWGDQGAQQHGDEPLSGVQGQGKATDPYDAGNRDVQPGAPSTEASTAAVPAFSHDPTGRSSMDLSPTVNEDMEPQLGSYHSPPFGNDSSAVDSSLNRANVPDGRRLAPVPLSGGDLPSDMSTDATTDIHSGLGLADRTSINPRLAMAGGIGGGVAAAAAGREAGLGESDKSQTFEQRAQNAGGGGGAVEPESKASQEALRGPRSPAPRDEYDFEKEMGGKATDKAGSAKRTTQTQGRQHASAMSKMKEKLGKVESHLPGHK